MKTALLIFLILIVVAVVFYSCTPKLSRKLLTENQVYHWKVYHVKEYDFNMGTKHYFEVYHGEHKLILPKEMTGGYRDISQFLTAGTYNAGETNYDSVLIIFESLVKDEKGFVQRDRVSITVKAMDKNSKQLEVMNICTGKIAILTLE